MRIAFFQLIFFLASTLAAAPAEAPPEPPAWQDPAAGFRLHLKLEKAAKPRCVDLRRLLLPAKPDNGVRAVGGDGRELPLFMSDDLRLFLPPEAAGDCFVYFGYDTPPPRPEWPASCGPLPENSRLWIKIVNAGNLASSERDWIAMRTEAERRQAVRRYDAQTRFFAQALQNKILMPGLSFRYSPDRGTMLARYRSQKFFDSLNRQLNSPVARKPRRRPRPDLNYPLWLHSRQAEYHHARIRAAIAQLNATVKKTKENRAKIIADAPGAPDREIVAAFDNPRVAVRGEGPTREILLTKRPFDADGNMAVRYSGKLFIEKDGDYELAVTSNSMALLLIDGKKVLSRYGTLKPSEVKTETVKVKLAAGLHDFALYYHKSRITGHIDAAIRPPGEADFRLLTNDDFPPALPVFPRDLRRRDGGGFPVIVRSDRYLLHTGKLEKYDMESYRVLAPADLKFEWELNGEKLPGRDFPVLLLPVGRECRLRVIPADAGLLPFDAVRYPPPTPQISVDAGLSQKFWLPRFIYSDEELDAFREINSQLPIPVTVRATTRSDRPQTVFPDRTEHLALPAKPTEADNRFAANAVFKQRYILNGAELAAGLETEFELTLPDRVFDRQRVAFVPTDQLPDGLRVEPEGLFDRADRRIVPVLNRPTLHQLRKWELLKKFRDGLTPPRRVLFIGEDFGGGDHRFSRRLAIHGNERGIETDFLPLPKHGEKTGSNLFDGLPDLLDALDNCEAESVVIIPPSPIRNPAFSDRETMRVLALLIERLQSLDSVREIKLATPVPSPSDTDAGIEAGFIDALRQLSREYGTDLVEFNTAIRRLDGLPTFYTVPDTGGKIGSSLPEAGSTLLANELFILLD